MLMLPFVGKITDYAINRRAWTHQCRGSPLRGGKLRTQDAESDRRQWKSNK